MRSTEAAALALVLESGFISLADVRTWADRYVVADDQPDGKILELCVEVNLANAISLLHELSAGALPNEASRIALKYIGVGISQGDVSMREAAGLLSRMADIGFVLDSEAERKMAWFAEDMALVDVGDYSAEIEIIILEDLVRFLTDCSAP